LYKHIKGENMKKNQLAAIIIGAVLITGSTVSISAASMSRSHHKSHSTAASHDSSFLRGVMPNNSWAALHSVLNAHEKKDSPVAPITAPTGLLASDTSTVTMPSDDDGINEENGTNNEVGDLTDDDDAPGIIGALSTPAPTTGIAHPMMESHGDSGEHSDQSQGDSND
jgi:hypothetical protein